MPLLCLLRAVLSASLFLWLSVRFRDFQALPFSLFRNWISLQPVRRRIVSPAAAKRSLLLFWKPNLPVPVVCNFSSCNGVCFSYVQNIYNSGEVYPSDLFPFRRSSNCRSIRKTIFRLKYTAFRFCLLSVCVCVRPLLRYNRKITFHPRSAVWRFRK